jgi:NAD(P)-dependent dehydrogenase (short-subunit alcohol dehydrogenase family)
MPTVVVTGSGMGVGMAVAARLVRGAGTWLSMRRGVARRRRRRLGL